MATPNDRLREARERTASPAHPDEGLTRQELAELVNAYIWNHHNKKIVALSANYVGKLERGLIRWPSKLYREALRAILGVPTDAALGFINARRAVVRLANVDRKQFVRGSAALGVGALALGPVTALLAGSEPTPVPVRVGATDIEQTRTAAQVFKSWDSAYGGVSARDAVLAQLRWSAGLLDASCPDRLRPELLSAVGYLAYTAGYIAFDANAKMRPAACTTSRWAAPSRPVTGPCGPRSWEAWRFRRSGSGGPTRGSSWPSTPWSTPTGSPRPSRPCCTPTAAVRWPRCGGSARR